MDVCLPKIKFTIKLKQRIWQEIVGCYVSSRKMFYEIEEFVVVIALKIQNIHGYYLESTSNERAHAITYANDMPIFNPTWKSKSRAL